MADDGRPVLEQINLVVGDMEAAAAFYRRLGVEFEDVPPEWAEWAAHHRNSSGPGVDLDLDSRAFASVWNTSWSRERSGVVMGFRLPDRDAVDAMYADLTGAGYRGQQEPYDAFWGARFAVVEDPDGNPVALMSAVDPERRSAPPDLPS
jgi:catechol 2,3-dioxygenase-like lactoylglutathione lyase family enzyme